MSKKKKPKLVLHKKVHREGDEPVEDEAVTEEETGEEVTDETDEDFEVEPEEAASEPEPEPEPEKKPDPTQLPAEPSPKYLKIELEVLQGIHDHDNDVTVRDVVENTNLDGEKAMELLTDYVNEGLLSRKWVASKYHFHLTDAGEAKRIELGGKKKHPHKKK